MWWVVGLGFFGLIGGPSAARADAPDAKLDARALAAKIDKLIEAQWTAKGAKSAASAGDAEFLRRIYLDLVGRIPHVSEVRAFLDDKRSDKRQRLVDKLLAGPGYVNHFTNVWRALLIPPSNNQQLQFLAPAFEVWLRDRLARNVGYDAMVRELITVNGANTRAIRQPQVANTGPLAPVAFLQVNEFKPENLAASTSRLFLGVKLECAQCHDHPFNKYTRAQFWELAAFFADIQPRQRGRARAEVRTDTIRIPGTNKEVKARFLDNSEPKAREGADKRQLLAEWITRADNPFFARATANRLWAHFFGIGLVEPVDEPGDDNPPSHPELLDELGRQFAAHDFDLKYLIRAITLSRAYQLSSVANHASQNDPRLFARMSIKGLTPEQLFDSVVVATGYKEPAATGRRRIGFGLGSARAEFLAKFASQDKRTESQTSILQALALMNGKIIADVTSVDLNKSETLAAILDFPLFDTHEKKIDALFLAALGRQPRPQELSRMTQYVNSGGPRKDARAALADVFWALLNSSEFILNH
jgi:hypothetical protein